MSFLSTSVSDQNVVYVLDETAWLFGALSLALSRSLNLSIYLSHTHTYTPQTHHQFLPAIALFKSSRRHPVYAQSKWVYVFAGRSTLVWPWVGVHDIGGKWFCRMLFSGFVQNSNQRPCIVLPLRYQRESMYHNGIDLKFVPTGPCCDPAVVKVDKRTKLCLTMQRFIYYYNLLVVTERKKESMKDVSTALAGQRETTFYDKKVRADTDLEFSSWFFYCISNMLGWFQYGEPFFRAHSQNGPRKLSHPHIFAARVQLRVFT